MSSVKQNEDGTYTAKVTVGDTEYTITTDADGAITKVLAGTEEIPLTKVVLVSKIVISAADSATKVTAGKTLQFTATVTGEGDEDPTDADITWKVKETGAKSTISETGLLTAHADDASVTVVATAKDASGVTSNEVVITIEAAVAPNPQPADTEVYAWTFGDLGSKTISAVVNTTKNGWPTTAAALSSATANATSFTATTDGSGNGNAQDSSNKLIVQFALKEDFEYPSTGKEGLTMKIKSVVDETPVPYNAWLSSDTKLNSANTGDAFVAMASTGAIEGERDFLQVEEVQGPFEVSVAYCANSSSDKNGRYVYVKIGDEEYKDPDNESKVPAAGSVLTKRYTGTDKVTVIIGGKDNTAGNYGFVRIHDVKITPISVPVTSLVVSPAEISLVVDGTQQLTATPTPADHTDTITYTSSDSDKVSVSETGLITAKAVTSDPVTITVKANDNVSKTVSVTVVAQAKETETINLNKTATTIVRGESETLTATIDEGATSQITWTSSNDAVSVTGGVVSVPKTVAAGTKFTVTATANGHEATCEVTVGAIVIADLTIDTTEKETTVGKTFTISVASITPDEFDDTIEWSANPTGKVTLTTSEDTKSVTVKADAVANAVTITAKAKNGTGTASCTVKIAEAKEGVTLYKFGTALTDEEKSADSYEINGEGQYLLYKVPLNLASEAASISATITETSSTKVGVGFVSFAEGAYSDGEIQDAVLATDQGVRYFKNNAWNGSGYDSGKDDVKKAGTWIITMNANGDGKIDSSITNGTDTGTKNTKKVTDFISTASDLYLAIGAEGGKATVAIDSISVTVGGKTYAVTALDNLPADPKTSLEVGTLTTSFELASSLTTKKGNPASITLSEVALPTAKPTAKGTTTEVAGSWTWDDTSVVYAGTGDATATATFTPTDTTTYKVLEAQEVTITITDNREEGSGDDSGVTEDGWIVTDDFYSKITGTGSYSVYGDSLKLQAKFYISTGHGKTTTTGEVKYGGYGSWTKEEGVINGGKVKCDFLEIAGVKGKVKVTIEWATNSAAAGRNLEVKVGDGEVMTSSTSTATKGEQTAFSKTYDLDTAGTTIYIGANNEILLRSIKIEAATD